MVISSPCHGSGRKTMASLYGRIRRWPARGIRRLTPPGAASSLKRSSIRAQTTAFDSERERTHAKRERERERRGWLDGWHVHSYTGYQGTTYI